MELIHRLDAVPPLLPCLAAIEEYFILPEEDDKNRRRYVRVPFHNPVIVRATDPVSDRLGPTIVGVGQNISMWGMGVAVEQPFPIGSSVVMSFHLTSQRATRIVRLVGDIRHLQGIESGRFFLGCEFREPLPALPDLPAELRDSA